jgi:hypothetical protein
MGRYQATIPRNLARWIETTEAANQRRGHETNHRRDEKALGAKKGRGRESEANCGSESPC